MFCKKCGSQLSPDATVCENCNTRKKEAIFCHKCATELPANSTRCTACSTKSRAHKSIKHWLPLGLTVVAFIFYIFGGYYYYDYLRGAHNYDRPYVTVTDFIALFLALAAFILSIVKIPRTRMVLKIISLILSGIVLSFAVQWILYVIL